MEALLLRSSLVKVKVHRPGLISILTHIQLYLPWQGTHAWTTSYHALHTSRIMDHSNTTFRSTRYPYSISRQGGMRSFQTFLHMTCDWRLNSQNLRSWFCCSNHSTMCTTALCLVKSHHFRMLRQLKKIKSCAYNIYELSKEYDNCGQQKQVDNMLFLMSTQHNCDQYKSQLTTRESAVLAMTTPCRVATKYNSGFVNK